MSAEITETEGGASALAGSGVDRGIRAAPLLP